MAYPSSAVAFVLGPQLKAGSIDNPWPWFDSNQTARGLVHGAAFPATPSNTDEYFIHNYYDLGLALYSTYYRTGDGQFLTLARKVADSWWQSSPIRQGTHKDWDNSTAPRGASLGGLILRAMDGRPEMWEWITEYTRYMFAVWVGIRVDNQELWYGVRDGGFMLLYASWLGEVHPEAAVREEFRSKALRVARDYYARLQSNDGGWYWTDEGAGPWEQPFMVGLLLDGMISVHRQSADEAVRRAILRAVEHLWRFYRVGDSVPELPQARWRCVPYFVHPDGRINSEENLAGGWDTNTIRECRQRNTLVLHAFGYAYAISADPRYREWGDELFAATFGKGQGPGTDPYYSLGDYRAREYNQAYRSAGRYLAWRKGAR